MKPRALLLASLLVLMSGCASHESEAEAALEAETPGARRAALARMMGIELPAIARREAIGGGLSVWLGASELAVVHVDGRVVQLGALPPTPAIPRPPARAPGSLPIRPRGDPPKLPDPLIGGLYDELEGRRTDAGLDVFVDRRVSTEMLARVLYTASRAGLDRYHLIGGSPEQPGAWTVRSMPFCGLEDPFRPPFTRVRADLVVEWSRDGLLARASTRPADRAPWAGGGQEEPYPPGEDESLPPPRPFEPEVSLRLADVGPQETLDVAGLARLSTALCAMNQGPTGVELSPPQDTSYEDLLKVAVALEMAPECSDVPRLGGTREYAEPAASGVAIDQLHAHALAQALAAQ